MKEHRILSAFQGLAEDAEPTPDRRVSRTLVFDTCQPGVVLRAVLFVETVLAVATVFGATDPWQWLMHFSLLTCGALMATLAWLMGVCALQRPLGRLPRSAQHAVGMALGALAGLGGCGLLAATGLIVPVPWLASAASGALMSGLLVAALVLRLRGRTPAATQARLAELQARIQPHFLFNTLNSAIALVQAEPAKAEAMLEDLSDLFRHALAEQNHATTLAEEIALARRYLAIEQVRFGDRLRLTVRQDPEADTARLPPLLLQPLVENAVKHGVQPSPDGADIVLSTERRGKRVVIKVSNTVPAGQGEPGMGLALDNARNRLRLLHDLESRFQTVWEDGVFQVRLEVPWVAVTEGRAP